MSTATVELRCEDSTRAVNTNANGEYEFDGLPDGECRITAAADGFVSVTRRIVLASDETSDLPFTLTRRTPATFTNSIVFADSHTPTPEEAANRFTLVRERRLSPQWTIHTGSIWDATPVNPTLGKSWQLNAGATYQAPGGIRLSGTIVGRRGYRAPLYVTQPPGSISGGPQFGTSLLDVSAHPTVWDTELRVEKILKSRGAVRISVVGEAFNLVNPGIFTSPTNPSSPAALVARDLQSRALRLGLVFGF